MEVRCRTIAGRGEKPMSVRMKLLIAIMPVEPGVPNALAEAL
jgi:hypothetical protein